jgi:hypothetical protein
VLYGAATLVCTPASREQDVGLALGAQAGEPLRSAPNSTTLTDADLRTA